MAENNQTLGNRRRPRRGGGQTARPAAETADVKRNGSKRQIDKSLPELARLNGIDGRGLGLKPTADARFALQSELPSQPNSARDNEPSASRKPPTHRGPIQEIHLAGQRLRDAKWQAEQPGRERQSRPNKQKTERDNTSITSNDDVLEGSCDSVESENSSVAPKHTRNQSRTVLNNLKLRIQGQHKVAH